MFVMFPPVNQYASSDVLAIGSSLGCSGFNQRVSLKHTKPVSFRIGRPHRQRIFWRWSWVESEFWILKDFLYWKYLPFTELYKKYLRDQSWNRPSSNAKKSFDGVVYRF